MPDIYEQTLRSIILQQGRGICEDPRRLKAFLADHLGRHPGGHDQAINVLLLALENRVVQDLLVSDALPAEMVQRRIADRLRASLGLTDQAAAWAVATWSGALVPQATPVPAWVASLADASQLKPLDSAVAGSSVETAGPRASSEFHSVTQAGFPPARVPWWRKPLGLALIGGLGGLLLVGLSVLIFSGGSKPPPTPTLVTKAEVVDLWKVIFRSDNPSLWNDDINDKKHFAMALELVPDTIRYLRLTDMSSKQFVIIPISKGQLGKRNDAERYCWNGTNQVVANGRSLGIYYKIWPPVARGDVLVSVGPEYRGWGFGPVHHGNEQGFAWEGKSIGKTIFEIAVKSEELTEAESKKLLKAGVPRQ